MSWFMRGGLTYDQAMALATAQELAAFLSNTPEAAAAKGPPSTTAVR